jgi:C4-dicarboxylate-specific signal transduction histidine kinase
VNLRARVRLALVLQASALGAGVGGLLLAAGLPLAQHGALRPRTFGALALLCALLAFAFAGGVLVRWVGRPLERLLAAAARAGADAAGLPPLGPAGEEHGHGLSRAAVAFERTAAALAEERARLHAKVGELERSNAELVAAREELLRAERLAAVGRLAAGIAHEVGNPLGAVTGYAELARARVEAGQAGPEVVDYLGRISAEAGRIDLIVRDLLDFARPAQLELGPVQVVDALDAALRLGGVQARTRAVTVRRELPVDLPAVNADARRLAQVFLNLLLNAADAMQGAGEVSVQARRLGDEVEVVFTDGGTGIPAQDLPRVFDPFFSTKVPGQGTGLGLAVCHGILESFGGSISAENHARGAAFRLRLRCR